MSGANDRKREERAFDSLIASQQRRERDITDEHDLPGLTEEELAAMNSIPSNIIGRLWEQEVEGREEPPLSPHDKRACALVGPGDAVCRGFNRAPDVNDDDHNKLDDARRQVFVELNKKKRQAGSEESDV